MHRNELLNCRFRTGSLFHLKEWSALDQHQKQWLHELADSEEVYGLFMPLTTAHHLTAKIADLNSALLFYHFQQFDRLPNCFLNRYGANLQKTIAQLVLDGVLEIEWEGKFLSGSEAVSAISPEASVFENTKANFLSRISLQAAAHAFLLKRKEVSALAQWLYTCHTLPHDGFTDLNLSTERDVYQYLFSDAEQPFHFLSRQWRFTPPAEGFRWFFWNRADTFHSASLPTFKLYISPKPRHLPSVFTKLLAVLESSEAFCFKAGASKASLLRPDKLLVYFSSKTALMQLSEELKPLLAHRPVHGVPFTGQLDDDGVLSWGVDPSPYEVLNAVEGGSWRTKVTEQLALAISAARHQHAEWTAALPFVTAKLRIAGIDVESWTATDPVN
jgi:hypothetical protein